MLFLIIMGFLAGFVDAVAGGGGLLSLPALLLAGVPPASSLGTNKVIGICASLASSLRYRASRTVRWRHVLPLVIGAAICGAAGAFCVTLLPREGLRIFIVIALFTVSIFLLVRRDFGATTKHSKFRRFLPLCTCAIGFYDGFFGPGTGTFLMLAFVSLAGLGLLEASARSRLINFGSNFGALAMFAARTNIQVGVALPAAAAAFLGSWLGASWAIRGGAKVIRPILVAVSWTITLKLVWDMVH